jgi:hypothetical protein
MPFRAIYRSLETVPATGNYSRTGMDWRFTSIRRCPDCFNSEISLRSTFAVSLNNDTISPGPATKSQAVVVRTA